MSDLECEINRTINAPIDEVFNAWVDPEQLKQWHCPEGMTVPEASSDAQVDGNFMIHMKSPEGTDHIATGTFREIIRPTKLVMSWEWQGDDDGEVTEVTVLLSSPSSTITHLKLIHRYFTSTQAMHSHRDGWDSVIDKLARLVDHTETK